eukprot:849921-Alexandrium_andersonii.AAC.1
MQGCQRHSHPVQAWIGNKYAGMPFGEKVTCDFCVVSAKPDVETINAGEGRGLRGQRYTFCITDVGT